MKKVILTIASILALAAGSQAQTLQTSTYVEKTHYSPKVGTSVGYQFTNKFELGGFYQKAVEDQLAEAQPRIIEEEFYGAFVACPIWDSRAASLKFNIRTGVSNGENFVITPSVMAKSSPIPQVSIGGGVGIRAFRPTLMATVSLNLSAKSKTSFLALK